MMSDERKPVLERTDSGVLLFWCPGCHELHGVWTESPNPTTKALWTWNGDLILPTFSPSVLVLGVAGVQFRCHSFIRDGVIEYLADSEHTLAGKKMSLPPEPLNQM